MSNAKEATRRNYFWATEQQAEKWGVAPNTPCYTFEGGVYLRDPQNPALDRRVADVCEAGHIEQFPEDLLSDVVRAAARHGKEGMERPRHVRFKMVHKHGELSGEATVDIATLTGGLWGFLQVVRGVSFHDLESVMLEVDGVEFGPGLGLLAKCDALERWLVGGAKGAS
jgi:hypothetical protein